MRAAIGEEYASRVVRNPRVAIDYLALRVPAMTPAYRKMQTYVHQIIATAFSNAASDGSAFVERGGEGC